MKEAVDYLPILAPGAGDQRGESATAPIDTPRLLSQSEKGEAVPKNPDPPQFEPLPEGEEPPIRGARGRQSLWKGLLEPIVEQPGVWHRIELDDPKKAQRTQAHLRTHKLSVPPGRWEFMARSRWLFARYLGPSFPEDDLIAKHIRRTKKEK